MESFWSSNKTQNFTGAAVLVIVSMLTVYLMSQGREGWTPTLSLVSSLFVLEVLCFFLYTSPWAERSRQRMLALLAIQAATIVTLYFLVNISFIAILGIVWIVQVTELFH